MPYCAGAARGVAAYLATERLGARVPDARDERLPVAPNASVGLARWAATVETTLRDTFERHTAAAHLRPAPTPARTSVSPDAIRPSSSASHSAKGTLAAEVLPKRSTFTYVLSDESPRYLATVSMIRTFAWCGISRFTSS